MKEKQGNQARALPILGLDGTEIVAAYATNIDIKNVDSKESCAAKDYFSHYHDGLNRRTDDPINSRLNYGYAVIRSSIARNVVAAGFHPAFGIHHNNQLNPFNLADDLIEPFRPMVDLVAHKNIGANERLTKAERYFLAGTLYNACIINGTKINILTAITEMCKSLKRIIYDDSDEQLRLPTILPIERIEGVTE